MWQEAIKSTVSGVLTDALLFSQSGTPLVHRYCVFGRAGAHASLRGSCMAKLRTFTVQVEAEGRWAHKRDSEQSSLLRKGSDLQRCVR